MKVVISDAMSDAGAAAARSLHLAGFEVHGFDARRLPRFMASRYLSGFGSIGDDPVASEEATLDFVDRVKADVFLPLFTPAAVTAVRRRLDFAALCRIATPAPEAFLAAYDKRLCMQSCSSLGIPCAGSLSRDDAVALLSRGDDQAVIVKPAFDVSRARGLRCVTTIEDLDAAIRACEALHGSCVLQESIPGGDDCLRMVTVVYGNSGRLIGGFSARKLRQASAPVTQACSNRSAHFSTPGVGAARPKWSSSTTPATERAGSSRSTRGSPATFGMRRFAASNWRSTPSGLPSATSRRRPASCPTAKASPTSPRSRS